MTWGEPQKMLRSKFGVVRNYEADRTSRERTIVTERPIYPVHY